MFPLDELLALDRLIELRAGAEANGEHDARTQHLLRMFSVLNACGIKGDVPRDQAHDPVNKDAVERA